jgi:RNA polymerase sigma-70 factor (ECF subfamily)
MNDPSRQPWEHDLLRHERFLLRLAARLAGPEVQPEDLVQDAFARALEQPPRARDGREGDGSLRAWLATVLRRSAGRSARGARRRAEREMRIASDAAPEAREEHAAVDARLDAHAELLALLRDLPEGERQALFLRYSEDLGVPAVAARLGLPLETVRTRLRRGRERLRAQLDARHGDRTAWAALLLPASSPAVAAATTPIGASVLVGTTGKILLGAAAAAAAFFLWIERRAEPAERASTLAAEPAGIGGGPAGAQELRGAALEPRAEARAGIDREAPRDAGLPGDRSFAELEQAGAAELPPAAAWPLVVRAEGAPAAGATIRVAARLDAFGRYDPPALEGSMGATNERRFDIGPHLADALAHAGGARAEELIVRLDHPDLVPAETSLLLPDPLDPLVAPDEPLVVVVRVERAAVVLGRVVDAAGKPLEGETFVQAHALRGDDIDAEALGSVAPEPDGSFRLRVGGDGPFALLAVGKSVRPGTALPVLARGGVVDVGDVVLTRGEAIDGRAVDHAGRPNDGANVFAMLVGARTLVELARFSFELPGVVAWHAEVFELFNSQVKTAADGSFRMIGLGPHRYVLDTQSEGLEVPFPLLHKQEVQAPATVELRPQAAELRLAFRFPGGVARDGSGTWTYTDHTKHFDLHASSFDGAHVLRYALPPNAAYHLALDFDGLAPAELAFDTPGAGQVVEREVVLAPDRAAARLILALRGAPVDDGMPFTAVITGAGRTRDRNLAVADRKLVLDDLGPGRVALELTPGEDRFAPQAHVCSVNLALDLLPGEERVVDVELELGGSLILEALDEHGARLDASCTVRTAAGDALDVIFVARIPDGRAAAHNHLFSGGPSRAVPELRPGLYRIEVRARGHRTEVTDVVIAAGSTAERSLVLRASD